MIVIGLTGSIGMGKTTTADLFRAEGVPVFDSDRVVHDLYQGPLVQELEAAFPGVRDQDGINRLRLADHIKGQPDNLARLEAIVHPAVRARQLAFIEKHSKDGRTHILLDIPLLYESGADRLCDVIIVVSAPAEIQRARVLARPGMSDAIFDALLRRQMPDEEKRKRADYVIATDQGLAHAKRQVKSVLSSL